MMTDDSHVHIMVIIHFSDLNLCFWHGGSVERWNDLTGGIPVEQMDGGWLESLDRYLNNMSNRYYVRSKEGTQHCASFRSTVLFYKVVDRDNLQINTW